MSQLRRLFPGNAGSPCTKDCPNRCADPNCHDEAVCDKWRAYRAAQAERTKEKEEYINKRAYQKLKTARLHQYLRNK